MGSVASSLFGLCGLLGLPLLLEVTLVFLDEDREDSRCASSSNFSIWPERNCGRGIADPDISCDIAAAAAATLTWGRSGRL